jgi:hypothetical protein
VKTLGRDEPCPCGSGKKYKNRHGSVHYTKQVKVHFAKLAVVGQRYMVKDQEGIERPATLTSATVVDSKKLVWCTMTFDDGVSFISTMPLSDQEFEVWGKYPDTFFGQLG